MRVNAGGYLFHQGRLDRMINTGYHIYPSEVEEAIMQVPGVAAVRVAGEPSKEWGVTVVADLVPEAGIPRDDLVDRIDRAATFTLTQAAFVRALDVRWTLDAVVSKLEGASGTPLPQNVRFSLGEWAALHARLTLRTEATISVSATPD